MPRVLLLSVQDGVWMCDFVGDVEVLRLFGATKLPTAFTGLASAERVLAAIQRLNPGCDVRLAECAEVRS